MPVYQELEYLAWRGGSLGDAMKNTYRGKAATEEERIEDGVLWKDDGVSQQQHPSEKTPWLSSQPITPSSSSTKKWFLAFCPALTA
jgi:hypothetical protein